MSEAETDPYRLYAIIRDDLKMPTGKLAAQAGHAYLSAYVDALNKQPSVAAHYHREGIGTKVCLSAPNEYHLLRAYEDVKKLGIPCALIIDQHHILPPHFDGSPIITALGIGPVRKDDVYSITKRFRMV